MIRNIEIQIDELALHGFARNDSEGIRKALESELTRLITEQGLPGMFSSPEKYHHLDAGEFIMPKGTKAGTVGKNIAGSVYYGIKNQKSSFKK